MLGRFTGILLFALLPLATASAQVKIGLMVSATGPTSAIGIPQRNTAALLPTRIGDATVEYFQLEDGGDTTRAVQNAKKRWVFKTTQNDDLIAAALLKHMVKNNVKTVGFIGFNDPYGENWYKVFGTLAEKAGIRIIASERYARADQSVMGQALKLIAAKPDAILIAAVGGPAVLPQATLFDQGYKGRIYQTHAVATDDFIKLGKEKVEGTVLAAGSMLVIDDIADTDPIKKVALIYIGAYEKQFGQKPATFGANTYDSGLILQHAIPSALKVARPGSEAFRSALRDAIEQERDVVGCQGVFNMSPTNHNGMDERARVLVTVKDGRFRLLPE